MATSYKTKRLNNGMIHVPDNAWSKLGLEGVDDIAIVSDRSGVHLVPVHTPGIETSDSPNALPPLKTLDEIQGSVKPPRKMPDDLRQIIEDAWEEAVRDKYR